MVIYISPYVLLLRPVLLFFFEIKCANLGDFINSLDLQEKIYANIWPKESIDLTRKH